MAGLSPCLSHSHLQLRTGANQGRAVAQMSQVGSVCETSLLQWRVERGRRSDLQERLVLTILGHTLLTAVSVGPVGEVALVLVGEPEKIQL